LQTIRSAFNVQIYKKNFIPHSFALSFFFLEGKNPSKTPAGIPLECNLHTVGFPKTASLFQMRRLGF